MSKHTAGPWYVRKTGQHLNNPRLTNIEICYGKDDECVADTVYHEADAHLMAAAPDLLAALECVVEVICDDNEEYEDDDYVKQARTAIAKAKGGR